ncbi:hypothetical protein DFJ74DRAFT_625427 [Hyaloraphidium curvatum]|nr:hypothetical protein DFJ74DRAFT_625427 [Hyaloraphidium curvatum]
MSASKRKAASAAKSKLKERDDASSAGEDADGSFDGASDASEDSEDSDDFGSADEEGEEERPKSKSRSKKSEGKKATGRSSGKKRKSRPDSGSDDDSGDEDEIDAASEDDEQPRKKAKSKKSSTPSRSNAGRASSSGAPAISDKTLGFLAELEKNNDREWFHPRKPEFDAIKDAFVRFASYVIQGVRREHDPTVRDQEGKDAVFRIYRDVRFGGPPYKPNISFALSREGRKTNGEAAVYYVHIQPGNRSFVGGGLWQPGGPVLAKLRDHIDRKTDEGRALRRIAKKDDEFRGVFGTSLTDSGDEGEEGGGSKKLKTAPRGYPKDHKDIELLRLKSFTVGKKFKDSEVAAPGFADEVIRVCGTMSRLIRALNDILDA